MSQALLFGIGCIVTVVVMTAVFILGFSQFTRLEDDADDLVVVARSDEGRVPADSHAA